MRTLRFLLAMALLVGLTATASWADWVEADGHKMHFPQLPDETGWDVNATVPKMLADDWTCSESGWIKDIHFWGSWKDDNAGSIDSFTISIYSDIPADPPSIPFSSPGELLWTKSISAFLVQDIAPGVYEGWYDPFIPEELPDNNQIYHLYNVFLPQEDWFEQVQGTVYWLAITAHVADPVSTQWGWKSSLEHWNDNAVFGESGDVCAGPDNGLGTVTLPADCPYIAPDDVFIIVDGLPPGTTVELDPQLHTFTNASELPGGSLGGTIVEFEAIMDLVVTGTGDLQGYSRALSMDVFVEYHTAPRVAGDPTQTFATVMWSLSGEVLGDPDFDNLRIRAGNAYSLPSPGSTTLTRLPSGDFAVDSFFDITYEIEFSGAPGGPLDGYSGITTGTLRLQHPTAAPTTWEELYEPDVADPISNGFGVTIDPTGVVIDGWGTDAYGTGWYYYPSGWWNIWFYDHPFADTRYKDIHIEVEIGKLDAGMPSYVEFAVNYSTDWWSLVGNPEPDPRIPPLPGVDEALAIGRVTLVQGADIVGHYSLDFRVPDYNPEWVSIDIQGENVLIPEGTITHTCIIKPENKQDLDLAFVVNGGPDEPMGACCLDGGLFCTLMTEADCIAAAGIYKGDGTVCLGDNNGNGIDDACEEPWDCLDNPPDGKTGGGYESEPNNSCIEADMAECEYAYCGDIVGDEEDWWVITLPDDTCYCLHVRVFADDTPDQYAFGGGLNPDLTVYADDCSTQLFFNDDHNGVFPDAVGQDAQYDCEDPDNCHTPGRTLYLKITSSDDQMGGPYLLVINCEVCECPIPPLDRVECEPQGGANPTHPPTFWYDVAPGAFGRCDFHVQVGDSVLANYSNWIQPLGWMHALHKVGSEWWVSWWDPGCTNAIFSTFRFQFDNPNPSTVGHWTTTTSGTNNPFLSVYDSSGNHTTDPIGYGYQVHVPMATEEPDIVKWTQRPDLEPTGMDVMATVPLVLADDFLCTKTGPITEIHVFGSWFQDTFPGMDPGAVTFTLSFHSDNPQGPEGWSVPEQLLWMRTFHPGEFFYQPFAVDLDRGLVRSCAGHVRSDG